MKILLCLNRDFMANRSLNFLWPKLKGHEVDIVLSNGVGVNAPRADGIRYWQELEYVLVEHRLFAYLHGVQLQGFKTFEWFGRQSYSGTLFEFPSINKGEGLGYVQLFAPDLIISIRFGHIFKAPVIAVPRHGILNLHSGILPDYRGIMATFWAMRHGEKMHGSTLHFVADASIDTGAVVEIDRLHVDKSRSLLWNVASLYEGGVGMISRALDMLAAGQELTVKKQDSQGRYFSYPDEKEYAEFLRHGYHFCTPRDYFELFEPYQLSDEVKRDMGKLLATAFSESA